MQQSGSRSASPVILCVDDEAPALKIRSLLLTSAGYDVLAASNASEAMEILRNRRIDLVITDHLLKGQTGAELSAHIKQSQPNTRIALLSGVIEPPEGAEYADAFLQKGMPVPEFLLAIKRLLA